MTVDQPRRLHLYEVARERFGTEAADTLMELLPPMDPSDLVTHQDLALTTASLRGEMAELRTELKTEMAELRTELKTEMAELRTELKTEMAELRGELRGELQLQLREQTNRLLMVVVPSIFSAVGLAVAAARL